MIGLFDFQDIRLAKTEADLLNFDDRFLFRFLDEEIRLIKSSKARVQSNTDCIVLCVVKNGETLLDSFFSHYRSIGINHMVFLDNGSDDSTSEIIQQQNDTTLLSTELPYKIFFQVFKRYLIDRFSFGQWVLVVDIDEFLCYPLMERVTFDHILQYLNNHNYNAVVLSLIHI